MKYSEKISKELNELLEKNYDAEKGYKFAAEKAEDADLQEILRRKSRGAI